MALATWWSTDPLPALPTLAGFDVALATDDVALAALNRLSAEEIQARRNGGHRAYVGLLSGRPVAYGWVATEVASIGELRLDVQLPPGDRYLWDFATRPEAQGRGVYPHLLQAILRLEACEADRFWIIYAPENLPSGAGMEHAGMFPVGQLSFQFDGAVGLAPFGPLDRAQAGADLLGVPLLDVSLAPCWRCGGLTADPDPDMSRANSSCWPPTISQWSPCTCAIQRKPRIVAIP